MDGQCGVCAPNAARFPGAAAGRAEGWEGTEAAGGWGEGGGWGHWNQINTSLVGPPEAAIRQIVAVHLD